MEPHPDRWTFDKAHPATQGWGISVIRSGEFPVIARTLPDDAQRSVARLRPRSSMLVVHVSLTRRPLSPSSTASAAWSARRGDCYPEEAEPPRTLSPEDSWLSSAVSWVTVSSG
jgi:hypothetical protein